MNFTPFSSTNRNTNNTIHKQPRHSETSIPYYQQMLTHSAKSFEPWKRNQQVSYKSTNNALKPPTDSGYIRMVTEGNKVQSNRIINVQGVDWKFKDKISNIGHLDKKNNQLPSFLNIDFNKNELYKSLIPKINANLGVKCNNLPVNQLNNNSSELKLNGYVAKKMPRASEPLLKFTPEKIESQNQQRLKIKIPEKQLGKMQEIQKQEDLKFSKNRHQPSSQKREQQRQILERRQYKQQQKPLIKKKLINQEHINEQKLDSKPLKAKVCLQDFIKIKQLGSGKYGKVYLVRDKSTGYLCAMKLIEKKLILQEQITDQFIRELKIQMYLNHPHIIKMYGYFHDKDNIYLLLQVATGGQMLNILKKSNSLPQQKVASLLRQICDAIGEIHSHRIIHRDIKPQNIVVHDGVLKLCDFGWSVHENKNLRTTFCGTPLYVCPEILKGNEYDSKIDIWSLGIMMFEMIVGQNPFKITKQEELIKIIKDQVVIPSYVNISTQAKDLLDRCLRKNPQQRSTIRQLNQHIFFKKYPEKQSQRK